MWAGWELFFEGRKRGMGAVFEDECIPRWWYNIYADAFILRVRGIDLICEGVPENSCYIPTKPPTWDCKGLTYFEFDRPSPDLPIIRSASSTFDWDWYNIGGYVYHMCAAQHHGGIMIYKLKVPKGSTAQAWTAISSGLARDPYQYQKYPLIILKGSNEIKLYGKVNVQELHRFNLDPGEYIVMHIGLTHFSDFSSIFRTYGELLEVPPVSAGEAAEAVLSSEFSEFRDSIIEYRIKTKEQKIERLETPLTIKDLNC